MAKNENNKICTVCGKTNNIANERCIKCNSCLLEGMQSGNITIDNKTIKRFRSLNSGPDIICPVCKTRNKSIAKNCTQCGAWLLDEIWKADKADDGYSHRLPSRKRFASSKSQKENRPASQTNWFGWLLLVFAAFYLLARVIQ
ncbi:MAG: hypothetical protein GXY49_05445 [Syntrophomonadaceae bacterium]|nr:hypothetical protein [Syntrophomonadaceae bacterium]